MLEYEGEDLEDVFMQPFQIGYKDVFGCDLTHELKEKGADIHVNHSNRQVSLPCNVKEHIYIHVHVIYTWKSVVTILWLALNVYLT